MSQRGSKKKHFLLQILLFGIAETTKAMLLFSLTEKSHGSGSIKLSWQPSGTYIASTGSDNTVNICDRHGEVVEEIGLVGQCTGLEWDKDGDLLAIVNNKSNTISLWDVNSRRTTQLDSSMGIKSYYDEDIANVENAVSRRPPDTLTFAVWSRVSSVLAVGNSKGNLLLYNHRTARKIPVIGKHTKKITCGAFSDKDLLALGAEDHQITVSNLDGDTLYTFATTAEPSQIKFAEMKESERSASGETTISTIIGKKVLMLINLNEPQNPINLQFQARYGDLVSYNWFGDGYVLLGFEKGFLVSISTHVQEIGQEIFSVQDYKSYLSTISVNRTLGKAVTVGDSSVKMRELSQLSEVYSMHNVEAEEKGLDGLAMTSDGQLLAVSGVSGSLYVYLTKLPVLGDAWQTKIAALTSLTQVTVMNDVEQEMPITFAVEIEPTFVTVGPLHVAIGMNNRVWFYLLGVQGAELVRDFEYLGSIQTLRLNHTFCAAMFEGKVHLHHIENVSPDEGQGRIFPDPDKSSFAITCIALTPDFLIFGTDGGHLQYFFLEDWKYINEFRHVMGVKSIHPEIGGTRLCLVDEKMDVFVYNPVNDILLHIQEGTGGIRGVLWENSATERDTFVTYDDSIIRTYIYYRDTIDGSKLRYVGKTKLPYGHYPLMLYNGEVTCQTQSGKTSVVTLHSHTFHPNIQGKPPEELNELLERAIALKRWTYAWRVCDVMKDKEAWKRLGSSALEHMDLDVAHRLYRNMEEVGMVWSLEEVEGCEDRNLLAGHLAMFLERFDLAEKLYLESTQPIEALEMRRDLLHWDKALQLANRLAPQEIPHISKEYAQQLEFTGDYSNAMMHYEKGIIEDEKFREHNESCYGGIAKMSIRLGDIRRGVKIAVELPNRALKRECAQILETMTQYNEACQIYENGQFFDRAAAVCIKAKNWMKVGELLPNVKSPKIHGQYAKAMEAEKRYKLAADAYKNAKDYDNLTRVLLDHLNNPEVAVKVVKESKSVEGAKLVAKFFLRLNDYGSAIQFLVISQCNQEAFKLAMEHDKMEIYADVLGENGTQTDYEAMGKYFEDHRQPFLGGKYYYLAGFYSKALSLLMANGEDTESLKWAIDCVGEANDTTLTRRLMDFLIGEIDGIPKDPKYLFRLYMALKMYREAAKTAIVIAREEQSKGQYRVAHDVLFSMYKELKNQNIKIPAEMETNLMLIHSYLLAKNLIKRGEHVMASRMLIRVAGNISRFQSHAVPILTTAVIECTKTGMKKSAFDFAATLMRPEYRKNIDAKFKKKIEAIVRKSDKDEIDPEEPKTPCCFCESSLPETELTCTNCKSTLPYCIVTGKHLVNGDCSYCPQCRFPGLFSQIKKLADSNEHCTMCGESINPSHLESVADLQLFLNPPTKE